MQRLISGVELARDCLSTACIVNPLKATRVSCRGWILDSLRYEKAVEKFGEKVNGIEN